MVKLSEVGLKLWDGAAESAAIAGKKASERTGLLIASGLISGEALIGITLAIPVAIYGTSEIFSLGINLGMIAGAVVILAICAWLYRSAPKTWDHFQQLLSSKVQDQFFETMGGIYR